MRNLNKIKTLILSGLGFYRLCSFLYVVEESLFSDSKEAWLLHKKGQFYATLIALNGPIGNKNQTPRLKRIGKGLNIV